MADEGVELLGNNAAEDLARRVDRRVENRKQISELKDQGKEFKDQDKSDGFDEKALMQIVKEVEKDPKYLVAQHTLEQVVKTYRTAKGHPTTLADALKLADAEAAKIPDVEKKKQRKRERMN